MGEACPYCDEPIEVESIDHIIPAALGYQVTVRCCKDCNDYMGANVDVALTRDAFSRIMAAIQMGIEYGPKRADRILAKAELRDGRIVVGYVWCEAVPGKNKFKILLHPRSTQDDGSKWVEQRQASSTTLPETIQVLDSDNTYDIVLENFFVGDFGKLLEAGRVGAKIALGVLAKLTPPHDICHQTHAGLRDLLWRRPSGYTPCRIDWDEGLWYCIGRGSPDIKAAIPDRKSSRGYVAVTNSGPRTICVCLPGFAVGLVPEKLPSPIDHPYVKWEIVRLK